MYYVMTIDYSRYPFLVRLDDYIIARYGYHVPLEELLSNPQLTDAAIKRIISSIKGEVFNPQNMSGENMVISFHLALIIVKALDSRMLRNRFALYESERSWRYLSHEDPKSLLDVLRKAGLDVGKLDKIYKMIIGYTRSGREVYESFDYVILFRDYLRGTRRFWGEPKWKLVNRLLEKGYVKIKRDELERIGKEIFYNIIQELFEKTRFVTNRYVEELVERVKEELPEKYYDSSKGVIVDELSERLQGKTPIIVKAFPPCIKRIYDSMLRGENLSHHERFAIATFLIALGMDLDKIVDLFRNLPDFSEKITRYQLEHLAGKRGGGRRYSPYNCENMRSRGLCISECNVKHPLLYYYSKIKELLRKDGSQEASQES